MTIILPGIAGGVVGGLVGGWPGALVGALVASLVGHASGSDDDTLTTHAEVSALTAGTAAAIESGEVFVVAGAAAAALPVAAVIFVLESFVAKKVGT